MITKEKVNSLSAVAKISITDMEAEKFADDLNDMFAFIHMINEKNFDTSEFTGFCASDEFFRQDLIQNHIDYSLLPKIKSDINISVID